MYFPKPERQQFIRLLIRIVDRPPLTHRFSHCKNPSDNKFLDLAVSGTASAIVTGDLHPFHDIPIITPANYLQSLKQHR